MDLFALRGKLPPKTRALVEVSGAVFFILIWWLIVVLGWVKPGILPSPLQVVTSFPELHFKDALIRNALHSIELNLIGYLEAVVISLPLGFLIGLFTIPRALLERIVTALRYLPLTAVLGLFILWFGISTNMKVQFLTLGILVYLLPVVIQRVDEVLQVYEDTVKTLGASKWQTIRSVYIPDVVARISDDVRVLVAISWTYIIIAEVINQQEGGIGAMIYKSARASRVDKVFAMLMVIILIGFLQDKLLLALDKKVFPHKYAIGGK